MTKSELIERIVDSFWDFSAEDPEDYLDMEPLDLESATMYLAEQRADERAADLAPEECLPDEVTPELYMEAENCYIRMMKHNARVIRLAKWLEDNDCVCEYDQYYDMYNHGGYRVLPVSWLFTEPFPFDLVDDAYPNTAFLIQLGQRSPEFSLGHEYCWYDKSKNRLFSANDPFAAGAIDAEAFAEFILGPDGQDALDYFLSDIMDENDIMDVFGCDESHVRSMYSLLSEE